MILDNKNFSSFLQSIKSTLKSKNSNIIYTYYQKIDKDYFIKLNKKFSEQKSYFYWSKPNELFSFIATGSIYTTKSEPTIIKSIRNLTCISNIERENIKDYPLFVGGIKFPLKEKSNLWNDFDHELWFVPEITLIRNKDKFLLSYNFLKYKDNLNEYIESKIDNILNSNNLFYNENSKIETNLLINNTDYKNWINIVNSALKEIEKKEVEKVVLARIKKIELKKKFFLSDTLEYLEKEYPDCYIFAWKSNSSIFFGASPEIVGKFYNNILETDALAGSVRRGNTKVEDYELEKYLLNDPKNIEEHNYVLKYILSSLLEYSEEIKQEKISIKKLKNIQHLWTPIKVKLKKNTDINTIVKKIYPSPAICGIPKDRALKVIERLENFDRGLYTGLLGWYNSSGNGEFAVGIRSALLKNNSIYLFAGCGIVNGSKAEDEYEETELKFKPIITLLNLSS
ncbi:MAG: isochorismate synthase [Melioribacter sp.]|nr:isochorismate synthase [Melioribacter sp.]